MEDNIKQVVKDIRYLIATDCNNETIQERIENYIKERDEALTIPDVVGRSEQYFCNNERMGVRCVKQCLGCFQFENKD